jgi:hypothetical protein
MKKSINLFLIVCSLWCCSFAIAENKIPPLNIINLQLQAEEWVTTKTAKVVVDINSNLGDKQLASVNADVMQKLAAISKAAEWRVTTFERTKDSSGLEKVFIQAEIRLPEAALVDLRQKAEKVSKPGETFTISNIDFTPDLLATQEANAAVRNKIYLAVKQELEHLNKMYAGQKYFLHKIYFNNSEVFMAAKTDMLALASPASTKSSRATMTVNNKIVMSANVELASK